MRHRKAFLELIRHMDICAYYEYGGEVNEYKSESLILMIAVSKARALPLTLDGLV